MRISNSVLSLVLTGSILMVATTCFSDGGQPRKDVPSRDVAEGNQAQSRLDGSWIGTTSQGQTISFKIKLNAITSLTLKWSLELDKPCASPIQPEVVMTRRGGMETWYFPPGSDYPPIKVVDNEFEASRDSADVSIRIAGTFDPNLSASGKLEFKNTPTSPCKGNATATWRAAKITPNQGTSTESPAGLKPSKDCSLKCDINKEGYGFGITCEPGRVDTTMEDTTAFEYGPQGQQKIQKLSVNQKLTYEDSKNTYRIRGVIIIDTSTNAVQYDISAVGGVFGDVPRQCKSGDTALLSPALSASSTTASAGEPTLSINPSPTFTSSILIPACKQAYDTGKISGNTYLCMTSEKGDFIGEGKTWIHTPGTSTFSVELSGVDGTRVKAKVGEGGGNWDLSFVPVRGRGWVAGLYENAERDPFQGPSNPGLGISGHSRACNKLSGRFEILELVSEGSPREIKRFAANFVQRCDGGPALSGYLRFNSTLKP